MSLPRNPNITSWTQVNSEVKYIHEKLSQLKSGTGNSGRTVILTASSVGGSTSTSANFRSNTQVLAAGTTFVPFLTDIGTATYHLIIELYSTDGISIPQCTKDIPQTSAGFTITVSEATIIKYTAVPTI